MALESFFQSVGDWRWYVTRWFFGPSTSSVLPAIGTAKVSNRIQYLKRLINIKAYAILFHCFAIVTSFVARPKIKGYQL